MPSMKWLVDHGCELTRPNIDIFMAVFRLSGGNPCIGCNCKDTCPAWRDMNDRDMKRVDTGGRRRCDVCRSLLNPVKVARRGGKCACGAAVEVVK